WGLYKRHPETLCALVNEEQVSPPADVVTQVAQQSVIGVGSGWNYSELAAINTVKVDASIQPRAEEIVLLAAVEFNKGNRLSALEAQPVYLRDTVSWQKRKRIRNNSIE